MVSDVYGRLRQSLEITADAVRTVDTTLEVASGALLTLGQTVETVKAATEQAAESSVLVESSVSQAAEVVGTDLPETIDAVRETMPALIEASSLIDTTLRGLALFGVPYDPDVPLGEGFRRLDEDRHSAGRARRRRRSLRPRRPPGRGLPSSRRGTGAAVGPTPAERRGHGEARPHRARVPDTARTVGHAGRRDRRRRGRGRRGHRLVSDPGRRLRRGDPVGAGQHHPRVGADARPRRAGWSPRRGLRGRPLLHGPVARSCRALTSGERGRFFEAGEERVDPF